MKPVHVRRAVSAGLLLTFLTAWPASAQEEASAQKKRRFSLSLGANVGVRTAADSSAAQGAKTVGLLWRFGQAHEGWGWHYGLGWYSSDVGWALGGQRTELGTLSVKPILVGYGYTHLLNPRTSISATVTGGYSFNSLHQHEEFADALRTTTGAESGAIDVANSWVLRPGVSAWYNVSKKIGVNVGVHYIVSRPEITVTSSSGADTRRLRADMFSVKAGVTYSIF